jgi:hypothetical protein
MQRSAVASCYNGVAYFAAFVVSNSLRLRGKRIDKVAVERTEASELTAAKAV